MCKKRRTFETVWNVRSVLLIVQLVLLHPQGHHLEENYEKIKKSQMKQCKKEMAKNKIDSVIKYSLNKITNGKLV